MRLMCEPENEPSVYIKEMMDEFAQMLECWDESGIYNAEVEEIEHVSRDGFIPFTNGGWEGTAYASFQRGKSYWKCLAPYEAGDWKSMQEEFKNAMLTGRAKMQKWTHQLPTDPLELAKLEEMTPEEFWDLFDAEPQYNESNLEMFSQKSMGWPQWYEKPTDHWRDEWEQGDDLTFFVQFRAIFYAADNYRNKSGEDEVFFFAAVNTDFDYGRDSIPWMTAYGADPNQHKAEFTKEMKVSEMTREKVKAIFDEMETHLSGA